MTFENIQLGRVARAVIIVTILGTIIGGGSCYGYTLAQIAPKIDQTADIAVQQNQIEAEYNRLLPELYRHPPASLNIIFGVQLVVVLLLALWQANWAGQQSRSPEQAVGYGVAVGIGVALSYGLIMLSIPANWGLKLLSLPLLIGACWWGGRIAAANLSKLPQTARFSAPHRVPTSPASDPTIYYNMGVTAAVGGRPDEARQHFTRVVQMNPAYLPAWLQLANLAPTPEQAWEYVQQARALNPNDPAVVHAVQVIWPQVARRAYRDAGKPAASTPDVPPPAQLAPPPAPPVTEPDGSPAEEE